MLELKTANNTIPAFDENYTSQKRFAIINYRNCKLEISTSPTEARRYLSWLDPAILFLSPMVPLMSSADFPQIACTIPSNLWN